MAIRGVNLGGWLVLERWITPSLFKDTSATDEWTLMEALGERASEVIDTHRRTFITESDFAWLSAHTINAVRIPIGYWLFGDEPPFRASSKYLDDAFTWAMKYDIDILIDFHAAPGSQNGWDHSGRSGTVAWHTHREHQQKSLDILAQLAERYGNNPRLWGIEILNEPHWRIPKKTLARYCEQAYEAIRQHAPDSVAVIFSDAFRPYDWNDVLQQPKFTHVLLDRHFYQCFDDADTALDIPGHLHKAASLWSAEIKELQAAKPIIAGEWSLALDGPISPSDRQHYAAAQLSTFNQTAAWFFWTYKTEESPEWDLRKSATLLGLKPKSA